MTGDKVISALIGLVGAVSNNGRTEQTDEVIREAFLHLREPDRDEDMVRQIHAAKNVIAPDCAVCKNPCGVCLSWNRVSRISGAAGGV